ncbi:hypothetical protein Chor_015871, partial [Crotalus horridus]
PPTTLSKKKKKVSPPPSGHCACAKSLRSFRPLQPYSLRRKAAGAAAAASTIPPSPGSLGAAELQWPLFSQQRSVSSSHVRMRTGSRILYRPISASLLSRPEVKTGEGNTTFLTGFQNAGNQLALREFQTSALNRDIDTAAKFIGADQKGHMSNPSLKQQLFSYAILGFALSEAMGLFCLMVAFLILFAM